MKKKQIVYLIIILLLSFTVNISAQNSMLFDKDQFQNNFNQKTPGLNTQQQGQFQQQMQNKKQQAIQGVNTAPNMSMGENYINGLEGPSMNQIDMSKYKDFHYDKNQVTPDKFKQDFSNSFQNTRQQNLEFGQSGINQAQNFDNTLQKDKIKNKFDNNKSGFENQFTGYKENNSKDLHSTLGDFENKFADFKNNSNTNKKDKLSNFNTEYDKSFDKVTGPNRLETGELKDTEVQNISKNTWNVYNGKDSKSANLNLGDKPQGWTPSPMEQFGEFTNEFKDLLPDKMKKIPFIDNNKNQDNTPIPEPTNENEYKTQLKNQLSNKMPSLFNWLD